MANPHAVDRSAGTKVVLLVVAASVVVVVAATGTGLFVPSADAGSGWRWAVRVAGFAIAAAGLAGLAAQRSRLESNEARGYDPSVTALVTVATLMAVLGVLARLAPATSVVPEPGPAADAMVAAEEPPNGAGERTAVGVSIEGLGRGALREGRDRRVLQPGEEPRPDVGGRLDGGILERVGDFLLVALALALAVLGIRTLLGRRRDGSETPGEEVGIAAAEAEAGLEASLYEVAYDGPDPRRQITAAYHGLLVALAEAGARREPQEAPHEHLHRTLGPLGVRAAPMHRLTELYVVAQFTDRPITDGHREAAAAALAAGLASLRDARVARRSDARRSDASAVPQGAT